MVIQRKRKLFEFEFSLYVLLNIIFVFMVFTVEEVTEAILI